MKRIVFFNLKGGVGKSATSTAISHMLAKVFGKRVLLVDIDPQGNSSSAFSEVDYFKLLTGQMEQRVSIQELLLDFEMDPHEGILKTKYENLDVIPAYLSLAEAEETIKADKVLPQQFKLKNQLDKIDEEYDYCIIDCSPSLSILNVNALVAADEVYIPMGVDAGSIMGARSVKNLVRMVKSYHPRLRIMGAFFTRYQQGKEVSKQAVNIFKGIMQDIELIPITIRNNKLVEESSWLQQPLLELDEKRTGTATVDYLYLTKYILDIDKADCTEKYFEYVEAEKELNRMKTLKSKKNSGKINEEQLRELKSLKKKYEGKKLKDFMDYFGEEV